MPTVSSVELVADARDGDLDSYVGVLAALASAWTGRELTAVERSRLVDVAKRSAHRVGPVLVPISVTTPTEGPL